MTQEQIEAEIQKLDGERQAIRKKMIALRGELDMILAKRSAERKIASLTPDEMKALGLNPVNLTPGPATVSAQGHGG